MRQKKPAAALWFVLAAIVLILAVAGGYRWVSSIELTKQLGEDMHIYRMEIWRPFGENHSALIDLDEETEKKIIDLISAPTYYPDFVQNGFGGDTQIQIYLKGQRSSGTVIQYTYRISSLGEVGISNLGAGAERQYLVDDENPFIVSREETRGFYVRIAELVGYFG